MAVEMLLFGAHPDDVEWGAGGIMFALQNKGLPFAVVDATYGEMGSRGTIEERKIESRKAAEFVGSNARENLEMPDCELVDAPETRRRIASAIRKYRPKLVLAPFWKDRHPDHAAMGRAVRNSELYCTLKKLDDPNPPYKPSVFLYYLLHHFRQPSFVIDISDVFEHKLELMRVHRSQFEKTAEESGLIPLGMGDYLFGLESRDRFFGSLIGVRYGEALVTDRPLKISNIEHLTRR